MTTGPSAASARYAIDAGGSSTIVVVRVPGLPAVRRVFPSTAATTVGSAAAATVTQAYLRYLRGVVPVGMPAYGCIASSSVPMRGEVPFDAARLEPVRSLAPPGRVLVVNDVLPLLWAPPLSGVGVVVSAGSGSCVFGRDPSGGVRKVGGHEYVLSDEGSAYAIGLAALRAAIADFDGVGLPTPFRAQAERRYGRSMPELARWLAESVDQRFQVAGFAPLVCATAARGGEHGRDILRTAAADLARFVVIALDALDLPQPAALGLAGGALRSCPGYRAELSDALRRAGHEPALTVLDGPRCGLHLADRLAAAVPDADCSRYAEHIAATGLVTVS